MGLASSTSWLARRQGADGSWKHANDDVTPLVVLAFLGAGYTHLSDGGEAPDPRAAGRTISFGKVVKSALRRIVSSEDDLEEEDTLRHRALTALALVRASENSGARVLERPARTAVERLVASLAHRTDEPIAAADAAWCALGLESATVPYAVEARAALLEACAGPTAPDASAMLVRVLLAPGREEEGLDRIADRLLASVTAGGGIDLEAWLFASIAFERREGPSTGAASPRWKRWSEAARRHFDSTPEAGRDLRAIALHALAIEATCGCPDAIGLAEGSGR